MRLGEHRELRQALGLASVPDFTTLYLFLKRLDNTTAPSARQCADCGVRDAGAADGTTLTALRVPTLQALWNYTSPGGWLSLVNATYGGGVLINVSQLGAIQLDATGAASASVSALLAAVPFDMSSWQTISNSLLTLLWSPDGSGGIQSTLAASASPAPGANPQGQRQPPQCARAGVVCALAPARDRTQPDAFVTGVTDRIITYKVFYLNSASMTLKVVDGSALVAWYEELMSGTGVICDLPNHPCSNSERDDPEGFPGDYNSAQVSDTLAGRQGAFSVEQTFFVDRGAVRVFWPTPAFTTTGFQTTTWSGAYHQVAAVYPAYPRIYQQKPDLKGVTCGSQCSKTLP